ncbi:MAG: hypothetical protein IPJ78_19285 [Gemmatimonadetes bacterium]|nr:hypothetical protein [Gemmatimonadota bacterium]
MTTAFVTSVLGLAMALTLRWAFRTFDRYQAVRASAGHTTSDVYNALQQMMAQQATMHEASLVALGRLQQAVGGDGDSSLQSQTKAMRTEMRDKLSELARVMTDFSEKVSELGTKALIEALSSVIRDFNAKLTEQFGENFKELNAAVLKLVQWQENYASQVALLEEQFRCPAGMSATRDAMDRIATASGEIPRLVALTDQGVAGLSAQSSVLERHLEAFAQVAARAQAGIPQIEANIARLTTGITDSVHAALEASTRAHAEQHHSQQKLTVAYNQLITDVRATVTDSQQQITLPQAIKRARLWSPRSIRRPQNWEKTCETPAPRSGASQGAALRGTATRDKPWRPPPTTPEAGRDYAPLLEASGKLRVRRRQCRTDEVETIPTATVRVGCDQMSGLMLVFVHRGHVYDRGEP